MLDGEDLIVRYHLTGKYDLGDDYAEVFEDTTSLAYTLIEIDQLAFNATYEHIVPDTLKIETEEN